MKARSATAVAPRLRALAALAALLCVLGVLAPITARSKAGEHSRVQAVKVVTTASSDQYTGILRFDQPELVIRVPATAQGIGYAEPSAASGAPAVTADPGSVRTRGPPV